MSRPSGPGVPPNGWPAENAPANLPVDGQGPYHDPYYAQRAAQGQQMLPDTRKALSKWQRAPEARPLNYMARLGNHRCTVLEAA